MNDARKPLTAYPSPVDFLAGGGEMGERIRAKDWSQTPLGPVEHWPQSLKTVVRVMLTSRQPIWIGWGPEFIKLYNDPYKVIVGGKHPEALGQPASVVWREIWDEIAPRLETAFQNNEGTYDEALRLIMERYGYPEETYYTVSYSPVPADEGSVGGIICVNTDDTQRIIGERQVKLLRALAAAVADVRTVEDACRLGAKSLSQNPHDLPFALFYLLDHEQRQATLAGLAGISRGHPAAPETVAIDEDGLWPLQEARRAGKICLISNLNQRVEHLPTGIWKRPPHQAVVVPIVPAGQTGRAGVLIAGLNPYRLFDEGYQGFIQLVGGELAASLARAHAYEVEAQAHVLALKETNERMDEFISIAGHELRTPVTAIKSSIQLTLRRLEREAQGANGSHSQTSALRPDILYRTERQIQRLIRLLDDMLDLSRIRAGKLELRPERCDLTALVREVVESEAQAHPERRILVEGTGDGPISVSGDADRIGQVITNYLTNALKYSAADQPVTVRVWHNAQTASVEVQDQGPGIPLAEQTRVWELFHRVPGISVQSGSGVGLGLGLHISKTLIERHEGQVGIKSAPGQGSTFWFTLPLAKDTTSD